MRDEGFLASDVIGDPAKFVDVPQAPALRDQPAPRTESPVHRSEQRVVVVDPVERRVREDDVRRFRDSHLDEVLAEHGGAVAESLTRMLGHRGGHVDRVDPATWYPVCEQRRDAAGAAAGIDHHLVAIEHEALELLERPVQLDVGDAVVAGGVPVPRRGAHSAVVTGPGRSRSRS